MKIRCLYTFINYSPIIYSRRLIFLMDKEAATNVSTLQQGNSNAEKQPGFISEGKAKIIQQENKKVFYNPVQEFNRDLSIAVLSVFADDLIKSKREVKRTHDGNPKASSESLPLAAGQPCQDGLVILEALSATGLRSIRFALEIPGVNEIIANDISAEAVKSIEANLKLNEVEHLVKTNHGDASLLMYTNKSKYDAVDLDPYGSPTRFLDSAVQSVKEGGVLLVTCTDMAVLAGNSPETCYTKYGALSLRLPPCHEMALRIALQSIEAHANRYGRYIQPLLSISVDFYIRLVVRVFSSQAKCKETTSKLSHVYMCVGCKSYLFHPLGLVTARENKPPLFSLPHAPNFHKCQHCGSDMKMGGPVWNAPLHDKSFVRKVLSHVVENSGKYRTERRLEGILTLLDNELDVPLYVTPDTLSARVHCEVIPVRIFRSALLNGGYRVSESHAAKNSVKTDAPFSFIWDIIRVWVKEHPVSAKRIEQEIVVKRLLSKAPEPVDLTVLPESATLSGEVLRYQVNPQPHWGPGYKATSNVLEVVQKRRKNQLSKKKQLKDKEGNDTE